LVEHTVNDGWMHSGDYELKNFITLRFGLILALVSLVCALCLLAWVPPVSRDALTHHLAVPQLYIHNGGMVELPTIGFSYFPMNLDLLYLIPLYFGNDILPKFIHLAFGLLTAIFIFRYLKKRLNANYGLLGALVFLSIPVVVKLSITVYVDLGLVFFTTVALIYLFKWHQAPYSKKHLMISAVFCGLALGTKYNGLVTLALLTLFVPFICLKSKPASGVSQLKATGSMVAYFVVALLIFSPWMIRNLIWTGNPVFPLYRNVFSTDRAVPSKVLSGDLQAEIDKRTKDWSHFAVRRIIYKESWNEIALIPIRIFFQGKDNDPKYFDGKLNPFLLILPIFAFYPRRQANSTVHFEKKVLLTFTVLFILFAFFKTSIRIRYVAPVIPALVILSVYGTQNLITFFQGSRKPTAGRVGTALVAAAVVFLLGLNAIYIHEQFQTVDPLSYLSGKVGRDEYIGRYRPEFPVMQYANRYLAKSDKIMGLFLGNRRYYCDRQLVFGENLLTRAVILASSKEDIQNALIDKGFTHIIVHLDLLRQWSSALNEREKRVNADFFNTCLTALNRNGAYVLFAINAPNRFPNATGQNESAPS